MQLTKGKYFLLIGLLAVSSFVGAFIYRSMSNTLSTSTAVEVDWRDLGDMDYVTGHIPDKLKNLNGKMIKIPGFMVPLEDNLKLATQFLLVPSPQACIHVPPPPPNQMVLIDMEQDKGAKVEFGPIWVYGILKIETKKHMYGESSFAMDGVVVEPYR